MAGKAARQWMNERSRLGINNGGVIRVLLPQADQQNTFRDALMEGHAITGVRRSRRNEIEIDEGCGRYRFSVRGRRTLCRQPGYGLGITLQAALLCGMGRPMRYAMAGGPSPLGHLLGSMHSNGNLMWISGSESKTYWELLLRQKTRGSEDVTNSIFWGVARGGRYARKLRGIAEESWKE